MAKKVEVTQTDEDEYVVEADGVQTTPTPETEQEMEQDVYRLLQNNPDADVTVNKDEDDD